MHHEVKLPKFKRYGILTKESMEIISTNLYDFVNINFSNSSNGIITGFDVEYLKNKKVFKINKGIIKYENQIYWLNENIYLDKPKEEGRYYLVFNIIYSENDLYYINTYNFEFKLENNLSDKDYKLFSIILREGAEISSFNQEFDKYRNEFNTINNVVTDYCCAYSSYPSISPKLLKKWASLVVTKIKLSSFDLNFALLCLNSIVSRECLVEYINTKLKIKRTVHSTNTEIIKDLADILNRFCNEITENKDNMGEISKIYVD